MEHPTHAWKYEYAEHEKHVGENRLWWGKTGEAKYPRLKVFLSETDSGLVPIDLWDYKSSGTTDEGGAQMKELFGEAVFDNPKPTRLIHRMLNLVTTSNGQEIVLDFFAGSCTTAQAVLELNREDGGTRRFIMVQLPEPTTEKSLARKAGYETIADIGKERIRRAIAQMQAEDEGKLDLHPDEDLGFKAFKLAPSHYRPWSGVREQSPDAYAQQMGLFADPLVDGWTAEDVIYEVALKEGYGLTCQITPLPGPPRSLRDRTIAPLGEGGGVYRVTDPDKEQSFLICLDDVVRLENLGALNLGPDDLFICRDAALDDETAANLALQCRLKTI